nr:hypothetical protein [uncultured Duganella sp.]
MVDAHIVERVGTLETDVAVMQSNYVRRDEFADLRTEVRVGFAQVDARFAETAAKIETGIAKLDAKIERSTATLLKWMFASQLSLAALVLAAVKYL